MGNYVHEKGCFSNNILVLLKDDLVGVTKLGEHVTIIGFLQNSNSGIRFDH